jgi:hypothetical protein
MTDTSFYAALPASYATVDTDNFDEMYADVDDGAGVSTGYGTAAHARARTSTAASEQFGGFGSAEYETAPVGGSTLLPGGYEVPASYECIDDGAAAGFREYDTAAAGAGTSSDDGAPAYANVGQPTSSSAVWAKQQMDEMVYADPTTSAAAVAAVADAGQRISIVAPIATRARLRAASASRSGGSADQSAVAVGRGAPAKGTHVQLGESGAPASSDDEYGWVSVTEDV